tara:strand:- start:7207 stop:7653 length:447 start_codon:yes stop_codon:yes gene_type:complete
MEPQDRLDRLLQDTAQNFRLPPPNIPGSRVFPQDEIPYLDSKQHPDGSWPPGGQAEHLYLHLWSHLGTQLAKKMGPGWSVHGFGNDISFYHYEPVWNRYGNEITWRSTGHRLSIPLAYVATLCDKLDIHIPSSQQLTFPGFDADMETE